MLTIEQYRQLWQLLACIASDYDVKSEMCDDCISAIYCVMRVCKKILEEN